MVAVKVDGDLEFRACWFKDKANFDRLKVDGKLEVRAPNNSDDLIDNDWSGEFKEKPFVVFEKEARFSQLKVTGEANFRSAQFHGWADFSIDESIVHADWNPEKNKTSPPKKAIENKRRDSPNIDFSYMTCEGNINATDKSQVIKHAFPALEFSPEQTVYVGDRPEDGVAAQCAAVCFVATLSGAFHACDFPENTLTIREFPELQAVLFMGKGSKKLIIETTGPACESIILIKKAGSPENSNAMKLIDTEIMNNKNLRLLITKLPPSIEMLGIS